MVLSGYVGHLQRSLDEAVSHVADMVEERDELQGHLAQVVATVIKLLFELERLKAEQPQPVAGTSFTVNPW